MNNGGGCRGLPLGANGGANEALPWREWWRYPDRVTLIGYHGTRERFERFDLDRAGDSGTAAGKDRNRVSVSFMVLSPERNT
jgi:hypothetical protein